MANGTVRGPSGNRIRKSACRVSSGTTKVTVPCAVAFPGHGFVKVRRGRVRVAAGVDAEGVVRERQFVLTRRLGADQEAQCELAVSFGLGANFQDGVRSRAGRVDLVHRELNGVRRVRVGARGRWAGLVLAMRGSTRRRCGWVDGGRRRPVVGSSEHAERAEGDEESGDGRDEACDSGEDPGQCRPPTALWFLGHVSPSMEASVPLGSVPSHWSTPKPARSADHPRTRRGSVMAVDCQAACEDLPVRRRSAPGPARNTRRTAPPLRVSDTRPPVVDDVTNLERAGFQERHTGQGRYARGTGRAVT